MRWTLSGLNLSVAPIAELAGYFLSCPLLRNGDRLHGASWRFLARGRMGRFRRRRGGGLDSSCCCSRGCRGRNLLLREALLESFHQINDRGQMRLGDFGDLLAFELGG